MRGGRAVGTTRGAQLRKQFFGSDSPATYTLIVIIALVGIAQWITRTAGTPIVDDLAAYTPQYTDLKHVDGSGTTVFEPWRMLTSAFLHGSFMHFAMNMLTLWIFGRALEPLVGSLRFVVLWVVSALGGSLAVALIAPNSWVVGASGAIFGLFGAWFLALRSAGADSRPMIVLIGLNVAISFINSGISWEAHIGGLVAGLLCGWLTLWDRRKGHSTLGLWLQIALGAAFVAIPPLVGVLA